MGLQKVKMGLEQVKMGLGREKGIGRGKVRSECGKTGKGGK